MAGQMSPQNGFLYNKKNTVYNICYIAVLYLDQSFRTKTHVGVCGVAHVARVPGPKSVENLGEGSSPRLVSLKQLQEALHSGPQPSTPESQGRGKLSIPNQEKYSLNFTYFPRTS